MAASGPQRPTDARARARRASERQGQPAGVRVMCATPARRILRELFIDAPRRRRRARKLAIRERQLRARKLSKLGKADYDQWFQARRLRAEPLVNLRRRRRLQAVDEAEKRKLEYLSLIIMSGILQ